MAEKTVVRNGHEFTAFVYEGEDLALEYPDGTIIPIPSDKLHLCLFDGHLPDGNPCKIVLEKSPITRLPIVLN